MILLGPQVISITGICFIHPSLAAWWCRVAGCISGPALPFSQPSVKITSTPILPFISSVLLFSSCSSMDGLCGRLAKVEQALFSPSVWVIVLASKGTGFADVKGSNSPNGVHINVHWTHMTQFLALGVKLTKGLSQIWKQQLSTWKPVHKVIWLIDSRFKFTSLCFSLPCRSHVKPSVPSLCL